LKKIIIGIVVEGDRINSIIHKSGFQDNISSGFEFIGILNKLIADEQSKLNNKLKFKRGYTIKEPLDNEDAI